MIFVAIFAALAALWWLWSKCSRRGPRGVVVVGPITSQPKGTEGGKVMFELSDKNQAVIPITYTKPDGSEGEVDQVNNPAAIAVQDESGAPSSAATATITADGKSVTVVPADAAADTAIVLVLDCDADLGAGVEDVKGTFAILIKSTKAGEVSTVNFGEPVVSPK